MYREPIRIESASAEVMSESHTTQQDGDVEVIWVTFDDGLTVSVARSSRTPNKMTIRGWEDPEDGPRLNASLWKPSIMTRELP